MYPTLTRYAGPAKANIRFRSVGLRVETDPWTSGREVLVLDSCGFDAKVNYSSLGIRPATGWVFYEA
jgi:hypothetical protein